MYVTVDFIRDSWYNLWGMRRKRELQNEKFFSTVGFDPGSSRLLDRRGIHAATRPMYRISLKGKLYTHTQQRIKSTLMKIYYSIL